MIWNCEFIISGAMIIPSDFQALNPENLTDKLPPTGCELAYALLAAKSLENKEIFDKYCEFFNLDVSEKNNLTQYLFEKLLIWTMHFKKTLSYLTFGNPNNYSGKFEYFDEKCIFVVTYNGV